MDSERGNWYLLTAIVLGFAIGLFYAWVIAPAEMTETHPQTLRADYKDVYRALIAYSFQATGDLERARARLELLQDENSAQLLAAQAQQILAEGGDYREARAMANLSASLLSGKPAAFQEPLPTDDPTLTAAPTLTATPFRTATQPSGENEQQTTPPATPTPGSQGSATPTATPPPPFVLKEDKSICDPSLASALIQVYALDASGEGIPGVEVVITWRDGDQERFYTGLKPEFGPGYGDFVMTPGETYTLTIPGSSVRVTGIRAEECFPEQGPAYWGSWQVIITYQD